MASKKAPKVGEAFNYTDATLAAGSAFDDLSDLGALKSLRKSMAADGIAMDGDERFLGMGALGIVARAASTKAKGGSIDNPVDIPGAVSRLEYMQPITDSAIALRPAFAKEYKEEMMTTAKYKVLLVPEATDIPDMPITVDDIKRTFQVLKAEGNDKHFWDLKPDAFTFVKGADGEVMRYSSGADVPEDFRGKPIAFVRDLNAMVKDMEDGELPKAWFAGKNINYDALPPAPQVVIDDAKQQYALTAKLAETLKEYGVEPNVPVPAPPSRQEGIESQAVGANVQQSVKR